MKLERSSLFSNALAQIRAAPLDVPRKRVSEIITNTLAAWGQSHPEADERPVLTRTFWLWTAVAVVLALVVRAVVVARAGGMMEGDEAVLGTQAEQILRGQLPIYFSGQDYMGSWDAYLLAPLVALFGPSATAMRVVQTLESLLLVPLTGALALKLFGRRALVPALLLAALPPLLPLTVQLHMWGGYTETLVLGTALMLLAALIAERWDRGRPAGELWVLGSFLTGLGLWIDPLIGYYLLACILWLGALGLARAYGHRAMESKDARSHLQNGRRAALIVGCSALAAALGAGPALYFALSNHFKNVGILAGGNAGTAHLTSIFSVGYDMLVRAIPDVVGARFFWKLNAPFALALAFGALAGGIALAAFLYALLRVAYPALLRYAPPSWAERFAYLRHVAPRQRWNDSFPLLLCAIIVLVYLDRMYGTTPHTYVFVERYLVPLLSVLILVVARLFNDLPAVIPALFGQRARRLVRARWVAGAFLVVTLLAFASPYALSDMSVAMRSPWAPSYSFPAHNSAMLSYLEGQHIRYVWTSHWIGNVVMYLSNQQVLCSDYIVLVQHNQIRFPQADAAVAAADRPSFIVRSHAPPGQSATERALAALGVTYQSRRFAEYVVITPLSRTVQPSEIFAALEQEQ